MIEIEFVRKEQNLRKLSRCRGFHFEQLLLALDAPSISAHISVRSDNAMTRDRNRYRITCACARDRAYRGRLLDGFGHVGIGTGLSELDRLQTGPHSPLKCSRLNIERQCRRNLKAAHVTDERLDGASKSLIVPLTNSEREFLPESVLKFVIRGGELNAANSFVGSGNENSPER